MQDKPFKDALQDLMTRTTAASRRLDAAMTKTRDAKKNASAAELNRASAKCKAKPAAKGKHVSCFEAAATAAFKIDVVPFSDLPKYLESGRWKKPVISTVPPTTLE